jgi:hypothetical protein
MILHACSESTVNTEKEKNTAYEPTSEEVESLVPEINNNLLPILEEGIEPAWADFRSESVSTSHREGSGTISDTVAWSWDYTEVCKGGCDETWNFISTLSANIELDCDYTAKIGSNKKITIQNNDTTWTTTINLQGGNITIITFTSETENAAPKISVNGYEF